MTEHTNGFEGLGAAIDDLSAAIDARLAEVATLRAANKVLAHRLADILEGLEGEKLSGAMPARVQKAHAALQSGSKT